ncbi:MAG: PIN domain-containing protein [Methylacidiphilales bacterium]|nr:PIN domain-containing protein [Candidatus Methylacidiphilales bacterium]
MSAKPTYLLDTNILLRFLTNDHPTHAAAAKKLFADAGAGKVSLRIPLIVITETVFTLQSYYGIDRADIGRELLKLLTAPGVTMTCPHWVLEAVGDYQNRNVSFGDACVAAEAKADQTSVASFDRGLDKFPGVKRHEPRL